MLCTAFIKPKNNVNDYRDAYTGNYFCRSTVVASSARPMYDTVTITVSKDVLDSVLQIKFGMNTHKFKIQNTLLNSLAGDGHSGKFFATDSLRLYMYGGHSHVSYIGKRK